MRSARPLPSISPQAAMACTAAIEDEIDRHYSGTVKRARRQRAVTCRHDRRFQADEREHRDTAIAAGAEDSPGYPLLYAFIRAGCRAAIALSKRI